MLVGSVVHSLDTKGRLVIPVKYREDFGAAVFAYKGVDECIRLYPREQFMKVIEKLSGGDVTKNALRRKVLGAVESLSLDAQGRILLSEELRNKVGITDRVRMVGMYEWLELWKEENYEKIEDELSPEDEIRLMAELGLA